MARTSRLHRRQIASANSDMTELQSSLGRFLELVDTDEVIDQVLSVVEADAEVVTRRLRTYLNECHVGLELIEPYLGAQPRILEVGAGVGALSAFLSSAGFEVVAIEPAIEGFELMHAMRQALDAQWPTVDRTFLQVAVEETSADLGEFDLAFSVNVLEHVPDVAGAIAAIHRLIAPGGRSVHVCPNYTLPYEPHFGLPLLPAWPAATARLLPRRITTTGLWKSLNFVTAGEVRRIARSRGLSVHFRPDVLGAMVDRLDTDPVFRERHAGLAMASDLVLRRLRLRRLLARWPVTFATPMVFELREA